MRLSRSRLRLASACLALGMATWAQAFDVVSVRVAEPPYNIREFQRSGIHLTWNATPSMVIDYAFDVLPFQIRGHVPDNVIAIAAETSPSATPDQLRAMFRTLLADRFKFTYHLVTETQKTYSLEIGKGGFKLAAQPPGQPAPPDGIVSFKNGGPYYAARDVPVGALGQTLAMVLATPVKDNTGLTGKYDFELNFQPPNQVAPPDAPQVALPTMFEALQQIGLTLAATTGPVKYLVVDHMESTPTPNP